LHSAIPYLKNLYALDVSRCHHLDDSTLQLLARPGVPASSTLRVLYLKSVRRISDVGLKAICHSNKKLEVWTYLNLLLSPTKADDVSNN
jgi:hypothetical protein